MFQALKKKRKKHSRGIKIVIRLTSKTNKAEKLIHERKNKIDKYFFKCSAYLVIKISTN